MWHARGGCQGCLKTAGLIEIIELDLTKPLINAFIPFQRMQGIHWIFLNSLQPLNYVEARLWEVKFSCWTRSIDSQLLNRVSYGTQHSFCCRHYSIFDSVSLHLLSQLQCGPCISSPQVIASLSQAGYEHLVQSKPRVSIVVRQRGSCRVKGSDGIDGFTNHVCPVVRKQDKCDMLLQQRVCNVQKNDSVWR